MSVRSAKIAFTLLFALALGSLSAFAAAASDPAGGIIDPGHPTACQWPFDPPPGWPDYLPWPCGPGPTFPLTVPRSAEAAGIAFYIASTDATGSFGKVVGLDRSGNERRRFEFQRSGTGSVQFQMSDGSVRVTGFVRHARASDLSARMTGVLNGKSFGATARPDGSVEISAVATLSSGESRLLKEFQQLSKELIETGEGICSIPGTAQAGCLGCSIVAGGLSLGAPGCLLTGPGMAACYGAWFVAAGTFVDQCTGACAD